MKKVISAAMLALSVCSSSVVLAQASMELEEACFMDVELTDYIVQVIETGSSNIANAVTSDEAEQISAILDNEENAELSISEKLKVVLTACSEGRILQTKNSTIINTK